MASYEVKLHAGGRDSQYLTFYMPRDIVERYQLKSGQTIIVDDTDNDGIVLMFFNSEHEHNYDRR